MTTLPGIPTDNMYKFLALFGLAMCLTAETLDHSRLGNFLRKVDEISDARAEQELISRELRSLSDEVKSAETSDYARTRLDTALAEYFRLQRRASRDSIVMERLYSQKDISTVDTQPLSILGILLTTIGFSLWYYKLQRFQDEAVLHEALQRRLASQPAIANDTER